MRMTPHTGLRLASLFPLLTLAACSSSTNEGTTDASTVTTGTATNAGATNAGPTTTGAGPTTTGAGPSTTTGGGISTTTGAGPTVTNSAGPTTGGGGATTTDGSTTDAGATTTGDGGATATSTTGSPTGGSGDWGAVENPSAGCSVPAMPSPDSLPANSKLPDPFTKMDGTRITDKSEWLCRREEILQQTYAYIYGEKPVPSENSVDGMVTESSISVQATGPEGTATFTLSVDMNGATAPAPAIIYYDGGLGSPLPIPNGVASIRFQAVEASGGSGPKTGPFYDAYGANHPLGILPAQAWQISRVLDLLEKNPGIIDPYRIGLTGCSRNGKGAFVGGVLDNRIALTVPVESGIGGTVALRLVEVLDTYSGSEWPFHAISYVRWLSEVQLGQFTTGNNAGADNTDKLPVDMHSAMALIAPRGLYIVDNPSTMYNGLDRNAAWVTGNVGKMIYEALGVGDNMAYQGAGGGHCSWRQQYQPTLDAMIDKFLKGNDSAATGNVATDLPNPPNPADHIDWEPPTLTGEL